MLSNSSCSPTIWTGPFVNTTAITLTAFYNTIMTITIWTFNFPFSITITAFYITISFTFRTIFCIVINCSTTSTIITSHRSTSIAESTISYSVSTAC